MGIKACERREPRNTAWKYREEVSGQEEETQLEMKGGESGTVVHSCNPSLERSKEEGEEFKASLEYKNRGLRCV